MGWSRLTLVAPSKTLWEGRIVSVLAVLFLLFAAAGRLLAPAPVVEAFNRLDYSLSVSPTIGIVALVCVAIYAIPRAAILGAILLTGYLGGAVATHLRVRDPLFDTLFPIIFGVMVWAGLFLRDSRLRAPIPLTEPRPQRAN
jgi:DoxX-like family